MAHAIGFIEVFGMTTALVAADAGCKAANVTIEALDKNKPGNADSLPVPLLICVKFRGSVVDVEMAIEAAKRAANTVSGFVIAHIIPNCALDTEKLTKLNCFE
ncbi:BMC domain-containing protein [Clostridium grantii]|uniref:BMC domain-containing protein n=1 Tax=Clostridium grantii DSM 8605 TaxID=1121316 RepID=A0A1M5SY62_9CLOT|nr:BMC domain-containing protein [Clostridium grantii]SHH43113.1 BMC domain-containing protein [Clostridium grantii DSM 8605]